MFFEDPLTKATRSLLNAVEGVTEAMNEKRRVIEEAEVSIKQAVEAINDAKKALNL